MVVLVVLVVLISLASAVPLRRSAGPAADRRMAEIHDATGVPLDAGATARLRPVVIRRETWPAIGRTVGVVVALSGFLFVAGDRSGRPSVTALLLVGLGGGMSAAFGLAAGSLVCHVAAGHRGFPSPPGSLRTVRVSARRATDYVSSARLAAWCCSTAALVLTVALDAVLLPQPKGGPVVLAAGAAALLLTALSWTVCGSLLRRPVPGPSRDELLWQEALLADSLQLVTSAAVLLNTTAVVLGLGAVLALREDLVAWGTPAAAALALACVLTCAVLARPLLRDDQPPALRRQDLAA